MAESSPNMPLTNCGNPKHWLKYFALSLQKEHSPCKTAVWEVKVSAQQTHLGMWGITNTVLG